MLESGEQAAEWALAGDGVGCLHRKPPPAGRVLATRRGYQERWPRPVEAVEQSLEDWTTVNRKIAFGGAHAPPLAAGEDSQCGARAIHTR